MKWQEVLENARPVIGSGCKACPVCNGRACTNRMPGPGAKGVGDTAIRNYDAWQEIRLNMDTLHVAIYDGNGMIVEAKGSAYGITHDRSANCKSIVAIRRFT